ncbi:MAG: Trk system potassium transporter TrkA [Thioalkalivibrionaceae bacterium]
MKRILILGAGQVGHSVAEALTADGHAVTVVDRSPERLEALGQHLDLRVVCGHAAHPDVLDAAGARDAEMLIAVTDSDEVNMIACQVASTLFSVGTKIARVRAQSYIEAEGLFAQDAIPVDQTIAPENLVTNYIRRLIEHPGALQVLDFADGLVSLVGVRAYYGGPLVGHELRSLPKHIPGVQTRVAAVYRRDRAIAPDGSTVIEPDDEVFFVAAKKNIRAITSELRKAEKPYKRIVIAGGGNVGLRLATALAEKYRVRILERDSRRAEDLAERVPSGVLVLEGDASNDRFLSEVDLEGTDVFCSVTNDDQANIFAGMLAKRYGVRQVIALINNPVYVDLVQAGAIDIAFSPQQLTVSALLASVREGGTTTVHTLRRGAAEAIETVVHGDAETSAVIGRQIQDLPLPRSATVGAIVRGEEVLIPHRDTVIEAEDHVILLLADRSKVKAVQKLFRPSALFF